MVKKITQFYVLEYSVSQNSYHVRTVAEMLETNHSNLKKQVSTDFMPLVFTQSQEEAAYFIEQFRNIIDARLESEKQSVNALDKKLRLASAYSEIDAGDAL